jgi:hypothetical protein
MSGGGELDCDTVVLIAVEKMMRTIQPELAVDLLYFILLGRAPDASGRSYYLNKLKTSEEGAASAIREIASSYEAKQYGILHAASIAAGHTIAASDSANPAWVFAALGITVRRLVELQEKFNKLDELARLTFLSVPEVSGKLYDRLATRLEEVERLVAALKQGEKTRGGRL